MPSGIAAAVSTRWSAAMHAFILIVLAPLVFFTHEESRSQLAAPRTLVAVLAHADDEGPVAPVLARYAREGVQVHLLIASDGGQGTGFAAARGDTVPAESGPGAYAHRGSAVRRAGARSEAAHPPGLSGRQAR